MTQCSELWHTSIDPPHRLGTSLHSYAPTRAMSSASAAAASATTRSQSGSGSWVRSAARHPALLVLAGELDAHHDRAGSERLRAVRAMRSQAAPQLVARPASGLRSPQPQVLLGLRQRGDLGVVLEAQRVPPAGRRGSGGPPRRSCAASGSRGWSPPAPCGSASRSARSPNSSQSPRPHEDALETCDSRRPTSAHSLEGHAAPQPERFVALIRSRPAGRHRLLLSIRHDRSYQGCVRSVNALSDLQ